MDTETNNGNDPTEEYEPRSIYFKLSVLQRTDAVAAKLERPRSYIVNKALEAYLPQFENQDALQEVQ